jgi:ATP-dependent Zn protease
MPGGPGGGSGVAVADGTRATVTDRAIMRTGRRRIRIGWPLATVALDNW